MSHSQPTPAPVDQAGALGQRAWVALAIIFALGFVHFWVRTTPVRLANPDDAVIQDIADTNRLELFARGNALDQARFHFATPLWGYTLTAPYKVHSPAAFSLLRALAWFAQFGLAGWLVARATRNPAWGAAVAFGLMSLLHIPPTFYAVLSYPPFWVGFCGVLAALHCHLSYLRRPGLLPGLLTGAFFLLGYLMNEVFVLFLPAFFALSWLQPLPARTGRLRANLAPLTVVLAYVGVYLFFSRQFSSNYEGTQFSPDLKSAAQVVARQMLGILPGFELVFNRIAPGEIGPHLRDAGQIRQTLSLTPWPDVLLGLTEGLALTGLLARCARETGAVVRHWPWILVFAAGLNLPIAFSLKYQVFIFHRSFPYVYAFYSYFFLGLAGVAATAWLGQRLENYSLRPWFLGALGVVTVTLCLSAMASNHRVLQILLQKYN